MGEGNKHGVKVNGDAFCQSSVSSEPAASCSALLLLQEMDECTLFWPRCQMHCPLESADMLPN